MVEQVQIEVGGVDGRTGPVFRYGVLERTARIARAHRVAILAWGFTDQALRVVLEGGEDEIGAVARGVRSGTLRASPGRGGAVRLPSPRRDPAHDVEAALVWAHRAPIAGTSRDPLETPWSSHRDLLGFRAGGIVDLSALEGRVDPRRVHRLLGGEALPTGWPPPLALRADLARLLRISAAVLSVLPADRRCFRLFVHLARHQGWASSQIGRALALTARRVRQLANEPEPALTLARLSLGSAALSIVP